MPRWAKQVLSCESELGESLSSLEKYDAPLDLATTSSLEALQAYRSGLPCTVLESDTRPSRFLRGLSNWTPSFAQRTTCLAEHITASATARSPGDFAQGL